MEFFQKTFLGTYIGNYFFFIIVKTVKKKKKNPYIFNSTLIFVHTKGTAEKKLNTLYTLATKFSQTDIKNII